MSKYTDDVYEVLKFIGGRKNIRGVKHCSSRLRFFLKDTEVLNSDQINQLENVKGSFIQGGQYQIVIGPEVEDFYREFIDASGVEDYYVDDKSNKKPFAKLTDKIKEIVFS
ncbi:MAG: PTS transporter subunit EIIB [Tissierellia bacterium]|nr:PTS transporter subunit EIIB [Tissierellia bacterium]